LAPPDDDSTGVTRLVLHLVDRSLITADRYGGAARYRLPETLRGYGLERLEESCDLDAAHGRHARWAVELVT
jgi:predicted ATPase